MITKLATFRGVSPQGEPLVRLFEPGGSLIKEAGPIMPQIRQWMASYKPQENQIAVLVNAMGASEYWGQNVNGDIFPEAALLHDCRNHSDPHPTDDFTGKVIPPYGYWTFLNAHPFVHHRNKDPNRAFGHVAFACWNPRMHRVELIVIIDKAKAMLHGAQHVVDRIMAGEYPDVSMGCRVPYDVCSICNHKSKTRDDYCPCVKEIGMGKILDDGRRIGVINTYPRFFDISFVFIGADKTAKVMCKLASGLIVPQSVAEADEVYDIPYTTDGLVKAACGAKSCYECRTGCRVKEAFEWKDVGLGSLAGGTGGALGVGAMDLAARRRLDPRFLKTLGKAFGEWGMAGGVTSGTMSAVKSQAPQMAPKVAESGSLTENEKALALVKKLSSSEEEAELLFSRPDDQETPQHSSMADGTLRTNAQAGDPDEAEVGPGNNPVKQAEEEGGTVPPMERIVHFLRVNPNPSDDQLHEWAEGHGFNVHEAERLMYRLATSKAKEASPSSVFERAKYIKIGPPPTPNRKEYPFTGTIKFRGLVIHVENKPGSVREGAGPSGKKWRTEMKLPYGEILGSLGTDGDKLDVYVGPTRDCKNVYIIHQNFTRGPKKGKYDEDKVMLGFDNFMEAKEAYLAHYDSPKFFRSMTVMAFPLFKRAVQKKEVHGEKVASAYQEHLDNMAFESEFLKEAARSVNPLGMYSSFGEAAQAAAEVNAELPRDMVDILGLVPRLDEMSGKYFLSYRPLSKEENEREFGKAAMNKTAMRADLDHLFQNASTAQRRQRTWKDKKTGKETTEVGSGLAERTKTASLTEVSPAVLKIAAVLKRGWSASDLLKVSNETKAASHLKWAEIVKHIGPSKAVGRVTPLLSQEEECLPKELLTELGQKPDLEKSLATPSLMGMVLKPEEFQRIILAHLGKDSLADKLDDASAVFKPSDEELCPCGPLSSGHLDENLMKTLLPFLEGKSYAGPVVKRRIIRITRLKPEPKPEPTEVDSSLLSKVSAAYTWYRKEQMKLASAVPSVMVNHPELHAGMHGVSPEDMFTKTAAGEYLNAKSLGIVLGSIPLSLMYSAHKRGQTQSGEDVGLLGRLIADHPWLTSMGVVTGLGAAIRNPRAQQAIDEIFAAGKRVWEGKKSSIPAQSAL